VRNKDSVEALLCQLDLDAVLTRDQALRLRQDIHARLYPAGTAVRRRGTQVDGWLGVATGLVKIENASATGRTTTLTNFSSGCWFGEGSVLKGGCWPFDAVSLTDAQIILLPKATFEWLLSTSFSFNRFLLNQFNARLAQFVERCEYERLHDAGNHVVHCLVEMIDPRFYPSCADNLVMSQDNLARLTGVSRSVVSRVLHQLQREGLLRVDYRSITLLDPEGLRRASNSDSPRPVT
jgi:CRP-like cAMP-binding protein